MKCNAQKLYGSNNWHIRLSDEAVETGTSEGMNVEVQEQKFLVKERTRCQLALGLHSGIWLMNTETEDTFVKAFKVTYVNITQIESNGRIYKIDKLTEHINTPTRESGGSTNTREVHTLSTIPGWELFVEAIKLDPLTVAKQTRPGPYGGLFVRPGDGHRSGEAKPGQSIKEKCLLGEDKVTPGRGQGQGQGLRGQWLMSSGDEGNCGPLRAHNWHVCAWWMDGALSNSIMGKYIVNISIT